MARSCILYNFCQIAEAILNPYEFERLKKINTEEPPENGEVKTVDLSVMLPQKGDKKIKEEKRLKILTRSKLLTKL